VDINAIGAASLANTQNQLAVSVLKKDISSEQGAEMAKMVAQAGGVGGRVDQYA